VGQGGLSIRRGGETIHYDGLVITYGGATIHYDGLRVIRGGITSEYDGVHVTTTGLTVYQGGTRLQTNDTKVPALYALSDTMNFTDSVVRVSAVPCRAEEGGAGLIRCEGLGL
jgi:hypothetical protein